jgi:hypothetical protein
MTCNTSAVAVCCSKASRVFGQEPCILHRDDRLRREILQQRNLLVGERSDLASAKRKATKGSPVFHQGDECSSANASGLDREPCERISRLIGRLRCQVGDLENAVAISQPLLIGVDLSRLPELAGNFGRHAGGGSRILAVAVKYLQGALCGPAQPHCLFDDRVEHRLKIAG